MAHGQKIGVLHGDGLFRAAVVLIHQDELHVHGIGMANGNGRLQPLEHYLELMAEGVRPGFELAKIQHLYGILWHKPTILMKAAELVSTRQFRLAEMPSEEPAPGEVQVRVDAVGICGSDLHYYSEGAVGDTPCVFPMVMGHEPSGTVVKCGSGVTGWSPGDRAALEPALFCYHCEFCRTGHFNVCANIRFLSTPGYPGFFREFVNLPSANLLAIPKEMSMEVATLAEPLAVALHSMKFAAIDADDTVAVFGAGAIGLLTIACAKIAGAARIWAVDPVAHRRDLAVQMGADVTLDARDAVRQIQTDTGGRGVDCA